MPTPISASTVHKSQKVTATAQTPDARMVRDIYRENLGREPDAAGMKHFSAMVRWLSASGSSPAQVKAYVAEQVRGSDEWRTRMVKVSYQEVLGRAADPAGLKSWLAEAKRAAASGQSSAQVHAHIKEKLTHSDEWRKRTIQSLYQQHLGRKPDPAGLSSRLDQARFLSAAGKSSSDIRGFLAGELQSSPEWRGRMVSVLYQQLLGRKADPGGHKANLALANEYAKVGLKPHQVQAHLKAVIQNSAEYKKKHPGAAIPKMPPSPQQIRDFYKALEAQERARNEVRSETGYVRGSPRNIQIKQVTNGEWLRADAADAFMKMYAAAKSQGVNLHLNSGFRSMGEQQELYRRYLNGTGNLAARPGYSNHQGGIAVDITTNGSTQHPAYKWLAANAAHYGFVRTVPSEPWHWEYRR